jgi:hypothetical protein
VLAGCQQENRHWTRNRREIRDLSEAGPPAPAATVPAEDEDEDVKPVIGGIIGHNLAELPVIGIDDLSAHPDCRACRRATADFVE